MNDIQALVSLLGVLLMAFLLLTDLVDSLL